MALKNPTPPTPPTPPTIDKGDGANNHAVIDAKQLLGIRKENSDADEENISEPVEENSEEVEQIGNRQVTTPETMARDAVANGAGSLTKKTVETPQENNSPNNQQTNQNSQQNSSPPSLNFAVGEEDRGKAALREFQSEDKISKNENQTLTESPQPVKLNLEEGHGGFYWVITLIFALVLGIFFVRKMLFAGKPKLKKSDLFEGTSEKLKQTKEKIVKPTYTPPKPVKPVKLPPKKDDDDKGKHFEIRV